MIAKYKWNRRQEKRVIEIKHGGILIGKKYLCIYDTS